ncbi:MAG TPA: mucoidy inhibitor MuiA family protein, partial [Planctomycetota bacterium]|nr:mucoidy inhibitor MuiA family protein [Planctomycetota bacterium]
MLATASALLLAVCPPAPAPAPALAPADPTPLTAPITEVVVYGGAARVRRSAQLPGSGVFAVQGLPGVLDPDAVRVRLSEGSVVSVEVDDRHALAVPDARVQELRARVEALLAERRVAADAQVVAAVTRDYFLTLLKEEAQEHQEEIGQGRVNAEAWEENLSYVDKGLQSAQAELRAVEKRLAELDTAIRDAQAELGEAESGDVFLRDVVVDVLSAAGATIDVEYLVGSAGWMPQYDLRTSADARSVEVGYRAKVWQHTGEDWRDCALVLSTAQPQRGAQGPDPRPIQVRIVQPSPASDFSVARGEALDDKLKDQLQALGY